MTQMLSVRTATRPATVLATEPADKFYDDGTATIADFPGSTAPEVGDIVKVRRTVLNRRGLFMRRPRVYRVEHVFTREVSAYESGTHYVVDVTTVRLRRLPKGRP